MSTQPISCPFCQSENVIKYGKLQNMQRYLCHNCKTQFSTDYCQKYHYGNQQLRHAMELYLEGLTYREIADILKISHMTVYNWIQNYNVAFEYLRPSNPAEKTSISLLRKILAIKENLKTYPFLLIDIETGTSYIT